MSIRQALLLPVFLCALLQLDAPAHAGMPMDGVQARHILLSRANPALDVPTASGNASVGLIFLGGGLIHGLVAMAIQDNIDKSRTRRHRKYIADLANDSAMADWARQFQTELGDRLQRRYGGGAASIEHFDDHAGRQRREVALAPENVVSAIVSIALTPHRDCGNLSVALSYGSAYMKDTKDVKRRPIKVYTPRPQRAQLVASEWCLPGSINTYQERRNGGRKVKDVAQLIAILDARKGEILGAIEAPPVGPIVADRAGTIGPRSFHYYVASYGRERSWIARPDHEVLRLVPNVALVEFECNFGCGRHERAVAEERARRKAWIRDNGEMVFE